MASMVSGISRLSSTANLPRMAQIDFGGECWDHMPLAKLKQGSAISPIPERIQRFAFSFAVC
jgi:hypothetical protein